MQKFSIWTALEVAVGVLLAMIIVNILFKKKTEDKSFNLLEDDVIE